MGRSSLPRLGRRRNQPSAHAAVRSHGSAEERTPWSLTRDNERMMNEGALHVSEPVGPRWELAKSLLDSGEAPVLLGNVRLWRSTSGPRADGRITVTVGVGERVSEASARESLRQAHETVDAVAAGDAGFAQLLHAHHPRWELVHDYGMGTVLIASEDADGNLVWPSNEPPG
jgi:hypothetical protein